MKVVYAHTDSIYVPIKNVETAESICKKLNNHVKKLFPNLLNLPEHPVSLEFEKYYDGLGVGTKRNRNAGFISWKDGEYLDEPEFVVTGYSMKRIAENKIAKEFQGNLLKMWAGQTPKETIIKYCKEQYNHVKKGRVGIQGIVKRGRVRKSLSEYKQVSGGIAGVCYYNQYLDQDNPINDSFFYIQCSHINGPTTIILPNGKERVATFIAVKEMKEFDERFTIDWNAYAHKSIVQKAIPIFEAMGWDIKEFIIDENQKSLREWL